MIDVTGPPLPLFPPAASRARLYTEMITTGALLHGNVARHLDFDEAEHPVPCSWRQRAGRAGAMRQAGPTMGRRNQPELRLPLERVQRGAFGACLMAEPDLVADCIKAMQDAVDIPVTVKHRWG